MSWELICGLIIDNISDDLLSRKWGRYKKLHPDMHYTFGHCYVVSEALYHMLDGKEEGWTPQYVEVEFSPHWFLKHKSGAILDLTAAQFKTPVPYHTARGHGFLTKKPSKRAIILMNRVIRSAAWKNIMKNDTSP